MRLRSLIGRHATHLGCSGSVEFDVLLEHCWVHEAEIEYRDGHGYRYGNKVEHGLVSKMEVVKCIAYVLQFVKYHPTLSPCSMVWVMEQLKDISGWATTIGYVLGGAPDLAWPEEVALVVLTEVVNDIGLLKEQTG